MTIPLFLHLRASLFCTYFWRISSHGELCSNSSFLSACYEDVLIPSDPHYFHKQSLVTWIVALFYVICYFSLSLVFIRLTMMYQWHSFPWVSLVWCSLRFLNLNLCLILVEKFLAMLFQVFSFCTNLFCLFWNPNDTCINSFLIRNSKF